MEELLSTFKTRPPLASEQWLTPIVEYAQVSKNTPVVFKSTEDVLNILQSQPDVERLTQCLAFITSDTDESGVFNLKIPRPQAAQIINLLVNEIVPNFWPIFHEQDESEYKKPQKLLLFSLNNIAGINALVLRLRSLILSLENPTENARFHPKKGSDQQPLKDILQILEELLGVEHFLREAWNDISEISIKIKERKIFWKQWIGLLAGGRLLSVSAEAVENLANQNSHLRSNYWLGDGKIYAEWLGRNVRLLVREKGQVDRERQEAVAQFLGKATTLGYIGKFCSLEMLMKSFEKLIS